MKETIYVDFLNTCLSICFINKSHENPTPVVWVCSNKESFDKAIKKLNGMTWIQILTSGATHVEM